MALFFAYLSVMAALSSGGAALLSGGRETLQSLCGAVLDAPRLRFAERFPRLRVHADALFAEARYPVVIRRTVFGLLGACGVSALLAGLTMLISGDPVTDQLALGLPWLGWHVRFDPLSGFFYGVIGIGVTAVSLYGPGYVQAFEHGKHPFSVLGLFTGLFVAGMLLVILADDAFFFMIAWELMSVASYFLVAYPHENPSNRRAALLYLLMAQVGASSIILAFGVLAGFGGGLTFDALRVSTLTPVWASIAFALALFGFGMKAGLVPLHAWLPEAHPVAPSHISALMSAVMLKVAVYGFIRFTFDLLGEIQWGWGVVVLGIGAASSVLGVLYAIMQHNLKRLLAYHSVENIGIIFIGLGLAMIFLGSGHPRLGALGFVAALYHVMNHALFKALLFLGAGAILHQSHETEVERMGGLIHRMPVTAALFLIGCMSISALPPLNGFVSEWLTFQAALQSPVLENGVLRSLIPVAAAALALTSALAAACFVKVYGIVFLGLPRSSHVAHAREVQHRGMLWGPGLLAACCVLFGVLPTPVINALGAVSLQLVGHDLPQASAHGWLWLTPVAPEVASYAPLLVLIGSLAVGWLCYYLLYRRTGLEPRQAEPWDCGFGGLTARMQYTSGAFSMPLRRIFKAAFEVHESLEERAQDVGCRRTAFLSYQVHVADRAWSVLYEPSGRAVTRLARWVGRIQTGNIRTYLGYSFFTLIILLWVISL